MKKIFSLVVILLLLQTLIVSALSASEAKQEWLDSKGFSLERQEDYREAKLDFAVNNSEENKQELIDSGKEVLKAALDEVEAWLWWKQIEAEEDSRVPEEIKENIAQDVEANLAKIEELRGEVEGVNNRLELGLVFLKMIGKYAELLSDVARNTGSMWVHIGNTQADKIADYEEKLREKAGNQEEVIEKLDLAKEELEKAKENINRAEGTYQEVKLPGTPLIKFGEGNSYLRAAKANLISASRYLSEAFGLLVAGGEVE